MATTPADPPSSTSRSYRPVFSIFEGGGAKGITHIGALRALEREGFALVGAAGTSAGAIIAALAAAGYTAEELFGRSRDALSDRNLSPLDLLGRADWARLRGMGREAKRLGWSIAFGIAGTLAALWLPWTNWSYIPVALVGLCLVLGLVSVARLLWGPWRIWRSGGLFSTKAMRDTLNTLLRDKLAEHYRDLGRTDPVPELIRFAHLDPTQVPRCSRLKIVATDSRSGEMVLFDHNTQSAVVADAVAASAAIPFVFVPPEVRGFNSDREPRFVDGGLISNLPAWSFRTEKRALEREQDGPPVPIFAFTLSAPGAGLTGDVARRGLFKRLRALWAFLKDVVWTGIFGSQAIIQDFVDDLSIFPLPSPLSTLSFDCSREEADKAYQAGLDHAGRALRRRRRTDRLTRAILEAILADMQGEIIPRRKAAGKSPPRLRLSLIDPIDLRGSAFRVAGSANMDADADDRLELDLRNDIAPRCFASRAPVYGTVTGRDAQQLWMTKYERALVHPELCSVISVPVFASALPNNEQRPPPQRVLCLDSSDKLEDEFNDATFMQTLTSLSASASNTLIAQQLEGLGS